MNRSSHPDGGEDAPPAEGPVLRARYAAGTLLDRVSAVWARVGAELTRVREAPGTPDWLRRLRVSDVAAVAFFIALAVHVNKGLWASGGMAATADNTRDHAQFLFFFEHAAHAVLRWHNPLFTDLMGAPDGVNLMANTAFLGMAVPLIPVTVLFGPGVSYALAQTIAFAGTAIAWYVVLLRHVTRSRGAAFAAAALCGFAPGVIGHGNGHPNIAAQFVLPFIISAVLRLRTSARPARTGVWLGLLITYQMFLNEELLLFTAIAGLVMAVVYAASRPQQARMEAHDFTIGLGSAAGVSAVLLAFPLWWQFFGPQHYTGPFLWAPLYYVDVSAYLTYGNNAFIGWLGSGNPLNSDSGETNSYLGLPLMLFALVAAVVLWRVLAVRMAAVVAAVFMLLSFGTTIRLKGEKTPIDGPWRWLESLPLFDAVISPRLALIVLPAVAVILAVAADRLVSSLGGRSSSVSSEPSGTEDSRGDGDVGATRDARREGRRRRALGWAAVAALLVPLIPTPLKTTPAMTVPGFITAGIWRAFVDDGTIVPVPPDSYSEQTLRWLVAGDLAPRYVDGYFLGPTSKGSPVATYGPTKRPTGLLLEEVARTGEVPELTDADRAVALADLQFWQADAVVLTQRSNDVELLATVTSLLQRPAQQIGGVWVWDVRDLTP